MSIQFGLYSIDISFVRSPVPLLRTSYSILVEGDTTKVIVINEYEWSGEQDRGCVYYRKEMYGYIVRCASVEYGSTTCHCEMVVRDIEEEEARDIGGEPKRPPVPDESQPADGIMVHRVEVLGVRKGQLVKVVMECVGQCRRVGPRGMVVVGKEMMTAIGSETNSVEVEVGKGVLVEAEGILARCSDSFMGEVFVNNRWKYRIEVNRECMLQKGIVFYFTPSDGFWDTPRVSVFRSEHNRFTPYSLRVSIPSSYLSYRNLIDTGPSILRSPL